MRSNAIKALNRAVATSAMAGALMLGAALVTPTSASAASTRDSAAIGAAAGTGQLMEMQRRGGPRFAGRPGFRPGPGPYRGRGWRGPGPWVGAGAAALIIGGAAAAAAANRPHYRECWIERRWVETPWGPEPRRVRVCD